MKKFMESGPYLYAAGLAGFGIIQLVTNNFLTGLLPVPAGLPGRLLLVYLSSGIFLLTAAGIFFNIRQQLSVLVAGTMLFAFLLFLHLPILISNIYDANAWAATFEAVMLASGAFIMAPYLSGEVFERPRWIRTLNTMCVLSRYLFALSLLVFAVQHIKYEPYIETLIPAWIPVTVLWSWLVIAGYLLAAISLVTRIQMFLASALLGSMFLVWVLILHGPRAITKLTVEAEWSSLFVALAVAGVAFSLTFITNRRPSTFFLRTP